jgi:hypothetical protein
MERYGADIVLVPSREVVHNHDIVSVPTQQMHGMRSDVAGSASNQYFGHIQ